MSHRLFVSAFVVSFALIFGAALTATPQAANEATGAAAIAAGRTTFQQFCAPCHGPTAEGNGPIASMLTVRPTNLTQLNRRNVSGTFPVAALEALLLFGIKDQTLAHGSDQMPVWGPTFTAIEGSPALARVRISTLLAYLESIQK